MRTFFWSVHIVLLLCGCATQNLAPAIVKDGVRFSIKAPEAKQVTIVGSFNQWDTEKNALSDPDADGVWSVTLPLSAGSYEYLFLINKEKWVLDPTVPSIGDGLGARNSVVRIRKK